MKRCEKASSYLFFVFYLKLIVKNEHNLKHMFACLTTTTTVKINGKNALE